MAFSRRTSRACGVRFVLKKQNVSALCHPGEPKPTAGVALITLMRSNCGNTRFLNQRFLGSKSCQSRNWGFIQYWSDKSRMEREHEVAGLVRVERGQEPLLTPYVNPRRLGMKIVSNQELLDMGSVSIETAMYFTLLGVSSGGFIASIASLTTGSITSPYVWAGWVAALIVSFLGSVVFGFLSYFAWQKGKKGISLIERESAASEIELLGR